MPSREAVTRIVIPASPEQVWAALRDLANYPQWNPVLRLRPWSGDAPSVGGRAWLSLYVLPLPVVVPVKFESASRERLCWSGGAWGIMRGTHYFELHEVEGGTELVHGEEFRGLLVPLAWPLLEPQLQKLYSGLNEALAAHLRQR